VAGYGSGVWLVTEVGCGWLRKWGVAGYGSGVWLVTEEEKKNVN